eukprot:1406427-Pyramimonas_sp.AAC.1
MPALGGSAPPCQNLSCQSSTLQDLRVTTSSVSAGPPPSAPACCTPAAEQRARPIQRWGPRPRLASSCARAAATAGTSARTR